MEVPLDTLLDYVFNELNEVEKKTVEDHLSVDDFDREIVIGLKMLKNRFISKEGIVKFIQKKMNKLKKNTLDHIEAN